MVDIENYVFDAVATKLRDEFKDIFVIGEFVPVPPRFPAVSLVEDGNSTYIRTLDSSGNENHSQLLYTVNVYSNKSYGKKAESKSIMSTIHQEMFMLGFLRVGKSPMEMPNADASVYRLTARYRAVASKDGIIYRK